MKETIIIDIKNQLIRIEELSKKVSKNGYILGRDSTTGRFTWHKKKDVAYWSVGVL